MAAVTVQDPDGNTWRVKRRWVSHTVRWRGPRDAGALTPDGLDFLPFADDLGCLPAIGIAVTVIAVVALAFFFVLPALVFAVELLVVLAAIALGVLARVLFRRPWTVEARRLDTRTVGRTWQVVGWRASGELVRTVAERVRSTGRVGDVTWTG
jgi:hypothetical protein